MKVCALADKIHLGRNGQTLELRKMVRLPFQKRPRRIGQRVHKAFQMRARFGPFLFFKRKVQDHPGPVYEALPHLFEIVPHARPILPHPGGQVAQKQKVADPAHLLAGPVRLVEVGAHAQIHDLVPGRDQFLFLPRFFFENDLPEPLPVVELHIEQHLLQDIHQVPGLREHALAPHEEPGGRARFPLDGRSEDFRVDTPGFEADFFGKRYVIGRLGAHLEQRAAEKGRIGQQVLR